VTTKALIILSYNEIEGSKAVYDQIPFDLFDELLVVDGGSTDGTVEYWLEKGHRVAIQGIPGRGSAFVLAQALTTSDILLYFSPDGNENPNDMKKIIEKLDQGSDLVVATRFGKGGSSDDAGIIRSFGNKMFTFLIRLFFRVPTTDAVNGYRGIYRNKFELLNLPNSKFQIEFQMTVRAGKMKINYDEVPTHEGDRIGGFSKAGTISVGWSFVKLFFSELFTGKRFLNKKIDQDLGEYKILGDKE